MYRWVFFAHRAGGRRSYDLYVGDSVTGRIVPIGADGINTAAEELGACYSPVRSDGQGRFSAAIGMPGERAPEGEAITRRMVL